mgnify:CR=1 FL=1
MRVHLRTLGGQTFDVEVSPIDTIREFLYRVQDVNSNYGPSHTTVIWKSQQLNGDRQIQSYGIMEDDTIHLMQRGRLHGVAANYYNNWRNTLRVIDVRNVLVWEYFSITTAGREWTREFEEAKQRAERENPNPRIDPRITVVSPQDYEIAAREELTRNVTTELAPVTARMESPIRARRELVRENSAGTQEAIEQVSNFISSNTGAGGAMKNRRSSRRKNRRSSRRVYKRKIVTH